MVGWLVGRSVGRAVGWVGCLKLSGPAAFFSSITCTTSKHQQAPGSITKHGQGAGGWGIRACAKKRCLDQPGPISLDKGHGSFYGLDPILKGNECVSFFS